MKMFNVLINVLPLMAFVCGIPLKESEETLMTGLNIEELAHILLSPTPAQLQSNKSLTISSLHNPLPSVHLKPIHSSHVIEASKDTAKGALLMPFDTMAESGAFAGKVTAGAGIKGTVVGSAIATPVILKAVALPGLAAGATSAVMSLPKWLSQNVRQVPKVWFNNVKTSVEDSAHNLANVWIVDNLGQLTNNLEIENDTTLETLDLKKGIEKVSQTVKGLKVGAAGLAVGMATKGLVKAKKGAYIVGRIILKPIKVLTGIHLKMLGTGLTIGGKLIGGTGVGIAKVGTAVKYAGLGHIGLGASAISWGLDKSTIDTHFEESNRKFKV